MSKLGDVATVNGEPFMPQNAEEDRIMLTVANLLGETSRYDVGMMIAKKQITMEQCTAIYKAAPYLNWRPFREVFKREPHHAAVSYWTARSVAQNLEMRMLARFDRAEAMVLELAARIAKLEAKKE